MKYIATVFILIVLPMAVSAQRSIRNDVGLDRMILAIADPIYNLEYDKAKRRIDDLRSHIPDHPIVDMLYALNMMWETMPDPAPSNFDILESHLLKAIEKADVILDEDKNDPEAIFFQLMAHGLLAQYYSEQGSTFKAMGEARRAYGDVISGFDLKEDYLEFYFSSGLYDYYREKYPELHPVYKSFVWVFRRGDVVKGLEELHYSIENSVLSRVEASRYLAFIYLRYEGIPAKALNLLQPLVIAYPQNLYFKMQYLEALTMMHRLEEGTPYILELKESSYWYYKMNGFVFDGILKESYAKNTLEAINDYQIAIDLGQPYKDQGLHCKSVAYLGLGRINDLENKADEAKMYYKQASKSAQTGYVQEEADTYLKNH